MSIEDGSACSGDMYVGVPTIAPVSARLWSVSLNSVALATPKSMIFGVAGRVHLGDHHVAGLEIAVDDPLLVGVLHGLADGDEQLQPSPYRESQAVAVLRDGLSFDELHHEERLAGLGRAAVVDAGNIGVIHQRQRLPLGVEPSQHSARIHPNLDELQCHDPRAPAPSARPGKPCPSPLRRGLRAGCIGRR